MRSTGPVDAAACSAGARCARAASAMRAASPSGSGWSRGPSPRMRNRRTTMWFAVMSGGRNSKELKVFLLLFLQKKKNPVLF
jgi:hypothetical protein